MISMKELREQIKALGDTVSRTDTKESLAARILRLQEGDAGSEAQLEAATQADEPKAVSTVVNPKYRRDYIERGSSVHCGDWLARELDSVFVGPDNKFNIDEFTHWVELQGVLMEGPWSKLPQSAKNGWQGRYRMNGRLKAERQIVKRGTIRWHNAGGDTIEEPANLEWLMARSAILNVDVAWTLNDEGKLVIGETK